ncbi:uncharacterized protein cdkn2a/b isoform X2 [Notolabrus celidotus]|uniref:uncharacterized protein cdkn2a/b isoform X2 n=1 Tax=Notolabrus celidotus TaxID=1203425 RepID=UPI00148FD802|nr:uncharacterized protein cdkn2a/b isoform X2 [Notolabrus celidotus]
MAMTREDELTAAAAKGNTAAVEELLRKGAQVDGLNRFGRTALQWLIVFVSACIQYVWESAFTMENLVSVLRLEKAGVYGPYTSERMKTVKPMTQCDSTSSGRASTGGWQPI